MSNCICGIRGIDLDGHQCIPSLKARIEKLEAAADVSMLTAHRACVGNEHDPANGKIHGCCVVCGVPWPCTPADPKGILRRIAELEAELNEAEDLLKEAHYPDDSMIEQCRQWLERRRKRT